MTVQRDLVLSPDQQELKEASRALVRAFGGTDAAGEALKRRQQAVSDAQVPNTNVFLTIADVATLESMTVGLPGHPHVTQVLARRSGHSLVKLPTTDTCGSDLAGCAATHAKEASDVTARLFEATRGGPITAESIRRLDLKREAREAVAASVELLAMIEAIEERGA